VTFNGADGGAEGVAEAVPAGPVPTELAAVTEKLYLIPFVSPVTIMGLDVPETVIGVPPTVGVAVTM
jgi:hypothetical protein